MATFMDIFGATQSIASLFLSSSYAKMIGDIGHRAAMQNFQDFRNNKSDKEKRKCIERALSQLQVVISAYSTTIEKSTTKILHGALNPGYVNNLAILRVFVICQAATCCHYLGEHNNAIMYLDRAVECYNLPSDSLFDKSTKSVNVSNNLIFMVGALIFSIMLMPISIGSSILNKDLRDYKIEPEAFGKMLLNTPRIIYI